MHGKQSLMPRDSNVGRGQFTHGMHPKITGMACVEVVFFEKPTWSSRRAAPPPPPPSHTHTHIHTHTPTHIHTHINLCMYCRLEKHKLWNINCLALHWSRNGSIYVTPYLHCNWKDKLSKCFLNARASCSPKQLQAAAYNWPTCQRSPSPWPIRFFLCQACIVLQ